MDEQYVGRLYFSILRNEYLEWCNTHESHATILSQNRKIKMDSTN